MITECAAGCGKQIIARVDNRAYLCRSCWRKLFSTLFRIIRPATEPKLTVIELVPEGAIIEEIYVA